MFQHIPGYRYSTEIYYIPGSGFKTETLMISKGYRHYFCDYTSPKTFDFSGAERHGTFRFSPGES